MALISFFEVVDNLYSADVRSHDTGQEPNDEDDSVLHRPVEEDLPGVRVPVGGRVDEGRCHEGESGHLDGPEEGDEEVQPWHGGSQSD